MKQENDQASNYLLHNKRQLQKYRMHKWNERKIERQTM